MRWALLWLAVFLVASLYGWWIERADKRKAAANAALRCQIEDLTAEEAVLTDRLHAYFQRQRELLDEYDAVWGHDRVNALPDGERLAGKEDVAYLEALLALPAARAGTGA